MSDFLITGYEYLLLAKASYAEIFWNLATELIKFAVLLLLIFFRIVLRSVKRTLKLILGSDEYGNLYGNWHVVRLSADAKNKTPIRTTIEVKRNFIGIRPRCYFRSPHISPKHKVKGYCERFDPNLFFYFEETTDTAHDTSIPFCMWFKNLGADFIEAKYGVNCGVNVQHNIMFANTIMSRHVIPDDKLREVLNLTKIISVNDAYRTIDSARNTSNSMSHITNIF